MAVISLVPLDFDSFGRKSSMYRAGRLFMRVCGRFKFRADMTLPSVRPSRNQSLRLNWRQAYLVPARPGFRKVDDVAGLVVAEQRLRELERCDLSAAAERGPFMGQQTSEECVQPGIAFGCEVLAATIRSDTWATADRPPGRRSVVVLRSCSSHRASFDACWAPIRNSRCVALGYTSANEATAQKSSQPTSHRAFFRTSG
jgi:hypothetical protein